MLRDVRVCLCGDEGVGKSSIISSLIKESFVQLAPNTRLPEVTIPPEVTDVQTTIVDTRLEDRAHLENEIRRAHVVGIVYAIDNPTSFDRVPTYWLPTIRALGVNVPVILIGNKIDLRQGHVSNDSLSEEVIPIFHEFKEVETCIECSARIPLNIPDVFFYAQNAVLHPTAPLYNSREHVLKPACVNALTRIFKICDVNADGLLDDDELNAFQRLCFERPLQSHELAGVKEVVAANTDNGISDDALTEEGFLFLQTHFIQRGRNETTWRVLRTFGYGQDLQLNEDLLHPRFDIPSDCTAELSPLGYQFFTDIFETFDKDRDGALRDEELADLFSTSPGNPWLSHAFPETTVTSDSGHVTLQGWLAQWSMTTLLEPQVTLAYLAYLGFPYFSATSSVADAVASPVGAAAAAATTMLPPQVQQHQQQPQQPQLLPTTAALQITRPRKQDRKKGTVQRNVFLAYVLGAAGSGKTSLLKSFVGKSVSARFEPTQRVKTVVNSVETGAGGEKYLVLQEFGSHYESEVLRSYKKLALADVLVFVYDSADTNSFSYVSNLRQQYKLDDMPSIFVATKSDLDLAQQRHEVQPDTYCRKLSLQVPVAVSVKTGQTAELFNKITSIAIRPLSAVPGGTERKNRHSTLIYASATCVALIAIGVVIWRRTAGTTNAAR